MRHIVLLGLTLLAFPSALKAVRLESTRLAPEASVWFEPNHGQVGGRTEWTARAAGAWLFLTSNEVVYALPPEMHFDPKKTRGVPTAKTTNVHMRMVGGRRVKGVGEKALGGYSNYFLGKHENEWFSGVPHLGQVRFPEVYPGIDVVFYTTGRNVEYDFIVKPGADPSVIELSFDGTVRADEAGSLVVGSEGKSFRQHRPRVFQGSNEIKASYQLTERGTVKIEVANFDPLLSLRVDPVLDFATYLGGPGEDYITAVELAADGNPVLVGATQSPASPGLDPFQQPAVVSQAPIILKLSADGRRVIFHTVLGRNGWDGAAGLSIPGNGELVISGNTVSANFPLKNPFQEQFKASFSNLFVTRISPDGRSLIYSSYLGGSSYEVWGGVTADDAGNSYFIGNTTSADFPTLKPFQARKSDGADGFITKVSPDGKLLFSTFFGGVGLDTLWAIKWRRDRSLILTGFTTSREDFPFKDAVQSIGTPSTIWPDSPLVILSDDGGTLKYSSLFNGTAITSAVALALDDQGRIYIGGLVRGPGFPLKDPLATELGAGENGFLAIFDATGKVRQYATILPSFVPNSISISPDKSIYLSGLASSSDAILKDSLHPFKGGGVLNSDLYTMRLSADGSVILFATVLGGTGNEQRGGHALAAGGSLFVAGTTSSANFPTKNAYQPETGGSTDGILFRLTDNSVPQAPTFTASPGQLTFRFVQGETVPPSQSFMVNGAPGGLRLSAVEPWLRVTQSMSVGVDPAGLVPGTYRGTVLLTPPNGVPGTVSVTLNVLAAAPTLSAAEPSRIAIGADDTEITLRGSGFTNRTTVQFGTVLWQLSPVRFINSGTLALFLPKTYFSVETTHSITVQNPDSAVSKPVSLAVGRPAPSIANKGIVSAASYAGDVVSPGEILTLFGENFEQGMRVNFDGLLATPLYITPGQLSVVAPTGLAGAREVNVIVEMNFDWRSIPVRIPVWPARPGLFTANSSGKGQAAALNQDGSVNSPANPAAKGSIAVLYGTGGGVENLPTKVFIDGIECEVLYAGQAPGLVTGAWQLNVRIPEFASKGEVVWRAGERESVEGVFVALKEN